MIRSENFLLQEVAGSQVVVPLGVAVASFSGLITLNEAGVILWNTLAQECTKQDLVNALTSQYEVSEAQAAEDVDRFLEKLRQVGAVK